MAIDWVVVGTIAAPLLTLFVGAWVNRRFESRPVLLSHFGGVSAFKHTPSSGTPIDVFTHSVVLRNVGRRPATNVRLHHNVLPDFNIWPSVKYSIETLPDGTQDIVIPTLIPKEEITISYLYFPPLTVSQINAGIKCDHGFARAIPVLLQRQYPPWMNVSVGIVLLIGFVTILYLGFKAAALLLR